MPKRLVIIGDLNGDDAALFELLRATSVIDRKGDFNSPGTHLVQLGDVVNRGSSVRAAIGRLRGLMADAPKRGGRVTMILGNHEAMVSLGNCAWCHPEEFLEFASDDEREVFERARARKVYQLLNERTHGGRTEPIIGALRAWEETHVPGRAAYAQAFGADGDMGKFVRSLPVAIRVGRVLMVHGGLLPRYADHGLTRLDTMVQDAWARRPETALDLSPTDPLLAEEGPLWCRTLVSAAPVVAKGLVEESLKKVHASTMVVGHTRTDLLGGERGRPLSFFDGKLICADTGIGQESVPACVVVEKEAIYSFRPDEKKERLALLPPK